MLERSPGRSTLKRQVGDAIVGAFKEHYGRGPEHIRIDITDHAVIAITRGGYSIVEGSLHRAGQGAAVRDQRRSFSDLIGPILSDVISGLIDREIVAVLADTHQDPDLGAIVFVLAPGPDLGR